MLLLSFWCQPLILFSVYLFHTAFQSHVPIVHPSTWTLEGKTPILSRATQACGAQFVKTRVARDFVSEALHDTRESLLKAVRAKTTCFSNTSHTPSGKKYHRIRRNDGNDPCGRTHPEHHVVSAGD